MNAEDVLVETAGRTRQTGRSLMTALNRLVGRELGEVQLPDLIVIAQGMTHLPVLRQEQLEVERTDDSDTFI